MRQSSSCEEAEEAHEHSGTDKAEHVHSEEVHRGVLSTISSAVQNTVSQHKDITHFISFNMTYHDHRSYT